MAATLKHKVENLCKAATTSSDGGSELVKYLQDSNTTNLVYQCIMDRGRADVSNSGEVVSRCIRFVRTHVSQYEPSVEILRQLVDFCDNVVENCANQTVAGSANILISAIEKQLSGSGKRPHYSAQQILVTHSNSSSSSSSNNGAGSSNNSNNNSTSNSKRNSTQDSDDGEVSGGSLGNQGAAGLGASLASSQSAPSSSATSQQSAATTMASTASSSVTSPSSLHNTSGTNTATGSVITSPVIDQSSQQQQHAPEKRSIVRRFLSSRIKSSLSLPPLVGTAPWTFMYVDMFGGHFHKKASQSGRFEIVHDDDAIRLNDYHQTIQRIDTISKVKKSEESKKYKESGEMPKPVKAPQLFAYKFYNEQPLLDLPTEKLSLVTNAAVTPNIQPEDRITASKIMIKVLVDQFCSGNVQVIREILALFFEMMEGNSDSKIHAFNLLFNLAIHANLISENVPRFDPGDNSSDAVPSILTPRPKLEENLYEIENILSDLFDKLCEMLLYMVHTLVIEPAVWQTAFNCFLFFVANHGAVDLEKIRLVDPRVFPAFIRYGSLSDSVRSQVVAMMLNVLYETPESPLDLQVLNEFGGIDTIISWYEHTRSADEAENLFVVIFDYAITKFGTSKRDEIFPSDVNMILQTFYRLGAPHMFRTWFRFSPKNASEVIEKFIFQEAPKRDPPIGPLLELVNRSLLRDVLNEIEKLALTRTKIEKELEPLTKSTLDNSELGKQALLAIKELVKSDSEYERNQGVQWMFNLCIAHKVDEAGKLGDSTVAKTIDTVLNNMVSQKAERRAFLLICDKILLYRTNKLADWSENDLTTTFTFLNEKLNRLITVQDKDEGNLLLMFDIIFRMVFIDYATECNPQRPDLSYDRFIQGSAVISYKVLSLINISLIQHLYTSLTREQHRRIACVLLLFMIELCRHKVLLESIGGQNFFKMLLSSRDPQIAYHASRFFIDQIKSERPEYFRTLMSSIVAKAQQANDERIIDNPYLQIHSIVNILK